MAKSEIIIDANNEKRLPATFGIEEFNEEVPQNNDDNMDWEPITIFSKVNGKKQPIDIRIGKGHKPAIKKKLKNLFQRYAEVFETDSKFFPFLVDERGEPYIHSLNLRSDAVIRNQPTTIKLPPEKANALAKLIGEKLDNGIFTRIPREENAYCTPVTTGTKIDMILALFYKQCGFSTFQRCTEVDSER